MREREIGEGEGERELERVYVLMHAATLNDKRDHGFERVQGRTYETFFR